MKLTKLATILVCTLGFASVSVMAADMTQDRLRDKTQLDDKVQLRDRDQVRDQDQIYGSQLMTNEERLQYQLKMQSATTAQERETIRAEHHVQMLERAKAKGVTLPAEPGSQGMGMGQGQGSGGKK